ncbi:DUF934 domain-containing protein [Palleronia sediminis]|uniref:DUF934 domain-containing protein n=1 Tax=Palleronia sediminis TaxID=2547833 RepID=A0A4R6A9A9_9RHOB|nr:DUF934 domain-containing protein [Palleronia sediminis]TDL79465.1 DUF934 domain-containing protein [Palleronia sediminis]
MSVIVTDRGFGPDHWRGGFKRPEEPGAGPGIAVALDLGPDTDPETLRDRLDDVVLIRVRFPGFADGRGFTIARALRRMGFAGRLRAAGHVIADQYAMARRSGFDEVEIDADLAARQPEPQWRARADWRAGDYRARLRG